MPQTDLIFIDMSKLILLFSLVAELHSSGIAFDFDSNEQKKMF